MKLIEKRSVTREYGFAGTDAIVDHPEFGRILMVDAFGGIDSPSKGCVRWRHGSVYKLHADDTFDTLGRPWNDMYTIFEAVNESADKSRPYLHFDGYLITKMADELGL